MEGTHAELELQLNWRLNEDLERGPDDEEEFGDEDEEDELDEEDE